MGQWLGVGVAWRGDSLSPAPPPGLPAGGAHPIGACGDVWGAGDRGGTQGPGGPARRGEGGSGSAVPAPPAPGDAEDSGRLGKRRLSDSCARCLSTFQSPERTRAVGRGLPVSTGAQGEIRMRPR